MPGWRSSESPWICPWSGHCGPLPSRLPGRRRRQAADGRGARQRPAIKRDRGSAASRSAEGPAWSRRLAFLSIPAAPDRLVTSREPARPRPQHRARVRCVPSAPVAVCPGPGGCRWHRGAPHLGPSMLQPWWPSRTNPSPGAPPAAPPGDCDSALGSALALLAPERMVGCLEVQLSASASRAQRQVVALPTMTRARRSSIALIEPFVGPLNPAAPLDTACGSAAWPRASGSRRCPRPARPRVEEGHRVVHLHVVEGGSPTAGGPRALELENRRRTSCREPPGPWPPADLECVLPVESTVKSANEPAAETRIRFVLVVLLPAIERDQVVAVGIVRSPDPLGADLQVDAALTVGLARRCPRSRSSRGTLASRGCHARLWRGDCLGPGSGPSSKLPLVTKFTCARAAR